ncbi:MAG TPA: hypothetical protein VFD92_10105 [Candidatus Binatia bacterium]|nr:hypothetical protein [Candidatus Binatia bacterium]
MIVRLLTALVIAAVALLGAEAAARWWVPGGIAAARQEREAFLASLPGEGPVDTLHGQGLGARAIRSLYRLHPFFGYTFAPGDRGANAQGFISKVGDFPYRKGPRELVIGLFGGSVAMQLAASPDAMLEPLRKSLAERGWERVTLVSFAVDGWRQPQSFYALEYYLDMIDVAVVLDGHNEALHLGDEELSVYPAAFPWGSTWPTLVRSTYPREEIVRVAELIRTQEDASRMTRRVADSPLADSMLAHLAWRMLAARYQAKIAELRAAAPTGGREDWSGFDPPDAAAGGVAAKRDAYLRFYEQIIADSDRLAAARGKAFFHFVQPNQYLRDSKPLSDEEKRYRIGKPERFELITPIYRRMEEATGRLRKAGVDSYFLGEIFASTPETVYSDDCCHLNAKGVETVANAIADRILATRKLETFPPHR